MTTTSRSTPKRRAVKRRQFTRGVKASVFVEAARLMAEGDEQYACHAICLAVHGPHRSHYQPPERSFFETLLCPPDCDKGYPWYGSDDMARTLGLLLCAELVREGFVPEGWTP